MKFFVIAWKEISGESLPMTDLPRVLQARGWIGRTFQPHRASGALGENSERIGAIVQRSGGSLPVLLVIIALRQRPDFVTAIVNPTAGRFCRRDIFAFVHRVHEQVRVTTETNLNQPAAQLRNKCQLHPIICDLLRLPTLEQPEMNLHTEGGGSALAVDTARAMARRK